MTTRAAAVFLALLVSPVAAQDVPDVPKDSFLVTLNGCAKNGSFVVAERREDQPGTLDIKPGRRFRLKGQKAMLNDIKSHQRSVVQVIGLIRQVDVNPQGVGLMGGRVRIGGTAAPQDPIANPARNPTANQAVLDVRSWKSMSGECR